MEGGCKGKDPKKCDHRDLDKGLIPPKRELTHTVVTCI